MAIRARFGLQRGSFRLDADFEAPGRGVTALFGESGSGKTTLLRCIAGLERDPQGQLHVNGHAWQDNGRLFLPPHQRPLGYVFQDTRLFPHLSVRANLAFGWSRTNAAQRRVRLEEAAELLGVTRLLDRMPADLSGGEKQRVAIARAVVTSPALLIMDEPLASLDSAAKAEILPFLERLHGELTIPVIYVSHVLDEVLRVADHMLLLKQGRVVASGPLTDMITRLDLPLAQSDQAEAVIAATVSEHDDIYHLSHLRIDGGMITAAKLSLAPGARVRVRVLARDVSLALTRPTETSIQNIFAARIVEIAPYGEAQLTIKLDVSGAVLLARITRKSAAQLGLEPGKAVFAQVKSVALMP